MVPFDNKSPFVTSGIRIGVAAVTTRGLVEADMKTIINLIDKVIINIDDEAVLTEVKKEVNSLMTERPLFMMTPELVKA